MSTIAMIVLLILMMLLIASMPTWPYTAAIWGGGYSVPGVLLAVIIIVLALAIAKKI